jgi:hypothetical protein
MQPLLKTLRLAVITLAFSILPAATQTPTLGHPAELHQVSTATSIGSRSEQTVPGAYLFLSSNTDEDLALEEARRRLSAETQSRYRHVASDILARIGLSEHETRNALGDWSDGVENSILVEISNSPDRARLRYAAAWFGLLANQKSVLLFRADMGGPDCVYQLDVPEASTPQLRRVLDTHGIKFRTILPRGQGHRVVVFDEGRQLRVKLTRLAAFYEVRLSETMGAGAFLGDDERAAAQRAFRQVIDEYEAQPERPRYRPLAMRPVPGDAAPWVPARI